MHCAVSPRLAEQGHDVAALQAEIDGLEAAYATAGSLPNSDPTRTAALWAARAAAQAFYEGLCILGDVRLHTALPG